MAWTQIKNPAVAAWAKNRGYPFSNDLTIANQVAGRDQIISEYDSVYGIDIATMVSSGGWTQVRNPSATSWTQIRNP